MDALNLATNAYRLGSCGSCKKCCILSCFGDCCCSESKRRLKKKHLFGKWPGVSVAGLPDNIKWENLGYTAKERRCRAGFSWLIALVLMIISIGGMLIFKQQTEELKENFNTDVACPEDSLSLKEDAYYDYTNRTSENQLGLMHCYCFAYALKFNIEVLNVQFTDINETDDTLHCKDWATNYALQNGMVIGTSLLVVIINIITCIFFERFVWFEKKHSVNDETQS